MSRRDGRPGRLRRARGCLVALAVLLAGGAVLAFMGYQLRTSLLTWAGGLLYHADSLATADAIVILGGGGLDREVEAADLYVAGYAPRVVVTRTPEVPVVAELQARGFDVSTDLELRLEYLEALGVEREAVTVLQRVVESTQAEAALVAEWAATDGVERIIIVTTAYHTSRVRLVYDRVFGDGAVEVLVRPSTASGFDPATWWHTRSDRRTGLFELEKYAYYRLMYLLRLTP